MSEQLDIYGGCTSLDPPPVPSVVFRRRPALQEVNRTPCKHCVMNSERFRRGSTVGEWKTAADIVLLQAIMTITQVDGSTLDLCGQHAREHLERGRKNG